MSKLQIEFEYGFVKYQNQQIQNGFYSGLKLGQGAAICYAVLVLLANAWTCMQDNQTSKWFSYISLVLKDYLSFLIKDFDIDENRECEITRPDNEI